MKQIYLHIVGAAMVPLALVACGNDYIVSDSENVVPVFTATIEGGKTRVIDDHWESGDEIGISSNLTTSPTTNVYNVCHVIPNSGGEITVKNSEEQIYFKTTSRTASVTFYAYFPYSEIVDPSSSNNTIKVNTSDQTKQKSFDYLFASAKGTKDSYKVELEFSHKMSMVTFVFKNGNDFKVSDIVSYNLGQLYTTANFNITTGNFVSLSNNSTVGLDVSDVMDSEPVAPLILIPQTISNPRLEIVDRYNNTYAVDLTFPSNKLVAGNNYKFTIKVSRRGLNVSECTIEDWNDYWPEGGGEGTADAADDPDE